RIYVPQVRKTTRGESTDQVQRRARYVVGLNHAVWIGAARFRGEFELVNGIAAVARQGDAIDSFLIGRAWFSELPSHAAHSDDGHRAAIRQHDCHLQDCLYSRGNPISGGVSKDFGAVAAL